MLRSHIYSLIVLQTQIISFIARHHRVVSTVPPPHKTFPPPINPSKQGFTSHAMHMFIITSIFSSRHRRVVSTVPAMAHGVPETIQTKRDAEERIKKMEKFSSANYDYPVRSQQVFFLNLVLSKKNRRKIGTPQARLVFLCPLCLFPNHFLVRRCFCNDVCAPG